MLQFCYVCVCVCVCVCDLSHEHLSNTYALKIIKPIGYIRFIY